MQLLAPLGAILPRLKTMDVVAALAAEGAHRLLHTCEIIAYTMIVSASAIIVGNWLGAFLVRLFR